MRRFDAFGPVYLVVMVISRIILAADVIIDVMIVELDSVSAVDVGRRKSAVHFAIDHDLR